MERKIWSFIPALLIISLALLPITAAAADPAACPENLISVSGSGEILTSPDIGLATFGVQTENQDVKAAQQENARIMDGIISTLVAAGIPRDDIQTVSYTIYPVYDDNTLPFGQKIKYYQVTSMVQVTVRDIARTGEIIDIAVSNGANQVSSVGFTLSPEKEKSLRAQALTEAVANARYDADVTAVATGVTITGVKSVSVGSVYVPIYYDNRYTGAAEMKTAAVPTPIETGQITVTAQVSISYLIR
ncbi:MAG: SIMPL domain-containing protein [Methanoregulaceae archaeon]|nr:SIMPL domain-containing protein [Methanoregulaceae archaeon]MCU0627961.1 SIMPL domain-containing protein [Methanoregulaceae archaeon]